jgi:polysaccharide chain length determinant protein (PEP-CTERM system associated)
MELNTPRDYIEIAKRRKWWIIIPFVLVTVGSYFVYQRLPKMYKATTLILVQPQKIPTSYVKPTVTQSLSDRLATISQQILSRTSLEQVISELHLIKNPSDPLLMSKVVASMRSAVVIDVHRRGRRKEQTSAFEISFEDQSPVNAARIVNKIASLFIRKNLEAREEQARGTSQFLEKELRDIEKSLKEKEEAIRAFKEKYMGELPTQLDANLRILERLQQEVQTNNQSIIAAQQRKANLEIQIGQMRTATIQGAVGQAVVIGDPLLAQLNDQWRQLEELQTQYTDRHPDVIAAKANIEKLEVQLRERKAKINQGTQEMIHHDDPILNRLNVERQEVIDQIVRLRRENDNLKSQIALYQRRVENAPKREEQMSTLLRDYTLLQENYQSLLDKKIQAQMAENLERKQKGEQFKVLDPATPPMYPFKPERNKVFGLALLLGLGLGGCLAFLTENMDRSFHKADDVEQFLGFRVIATLPRIETRKGKGN